MSAFTVFTEKIHFMKGCYKVPSRYCLTFVYEKYPPTSKDQYKSALTNRRQQRIKRKITVDRAGLAIHRVVINLSSFPDTSVSQTETFPLTSSSLEKTFSLLEETRSPR